MNNQIFYDDPPMEMPDNTIPADLPPVNPPVLPEADPPEIKDVPAPDIKELPKKEAPTPSPDKEIDQIPREDPDEDINSDKDKRQL